MPDAWEILVANSSLNSGDAWEHLNAQQGGESVTIVQGPTAYRARIAKIESAAELAGIKTSAGIDALKPKTTLKTLNATATLKNV